MVKDSKQDSVPRAAKQGVGGDDPDPDDDIAGCDGTDCAIAAGDNDGDGAVGNGGVHAGDRRV